MSDHEKLLPLLTESPEETGVCCPYCGSDELQGMDEHAVLPQVFRVGAPDFGPDYGAYDDEIGAYHRVECIRCKKLLWLDTETPEGYYPDAVIDRVCNAIDQLDLGPITSSRLMHLLKFHASDRLTEVPR